MSEPRWLNDLPKAANDFEREMYMQPGGLVCTRDNQDNTIGNLFIGGQLVFAGRAAEWRKLAEMFLKTADVLEKP